MGLIRRPSFRTPHDSGAPRVQAGSIVCDSQWQTIAPPSSTDSRLNQLTQHTASVTTLISRYGPDRQHQIGEWQGHRHQQIIRVRNRLLALSRNSEGWHSTAYSGNLSPVVNAVLALRLHELSESAPQCSPAEPVSNQCSAQRFYAIPLLDPLNERSPRPSKGG